MRLRRRRPHPPVEGLVPLTDDMPKDGLFAQPLVVDRLLARDPEAAGDGAVTVEFRATIKDAEGRRCPDVAVQATVAGPERTATGETTTDLMGTVRFRMTGPPGTYAITIDDVAAGGLAWDPTQGLVTLATEA